MPAQTRLIWSMSPEASLTPTTLAISAQRMVVAAVMLTAVRRRMLYITTGRPEAASAIA